MPKKTQRNSKFWGTFAVVLFASPSYTLDHIPKVIHIVIWPGPCLVRCLHKILFGWMFGQLLLCRFKVKLFGKCSKLSKKKTAQANLLCISHACSHKEWSEIFWVCLLDPGPFAFVLHGYLWPSPVMIRLLKSTKRINPIELFSINPIFPTYTRSM